MDEEHDVCSYSYKGERGPLKPDPDIAGWGVRIDAVKPLAEQR